MKAWYSRYRSWLIKYLFLVSLPVMLSLSCGKTEPPNVLLISLDACRADHLSMYGYHRKTSPFLDELASKGIRFENAFVNTHSTPPSHTTMLSSLYQETHRVGYFPKEEGTFRVPDGVMMLQENLRKHDYVTLAVTDGGLMGRKYGFDKGFDYYDDGGGGVLSGTHKIIDLIKLVGLRHSKRVPIFAFYHTYEIHSPYAPPEKYTDIFGHFKSSFSPSSENLLEYWNRAQDVKEPDIEFLVAMYDAEIRYTDDTLKSTFAELERLGFFENCLVIVTSDHGELLGDRGYFLHPGFLYEELLHIPLIITGTNVPSGKVEERLASSVDIAPTILAYLGLPVSERMEGKNLLGSTTGESEAAVFSQYGKERYSIRTTHWKLIETTNPFRLELYDVQNDSHEKKDVADREPEVLTRLHKELGVWRDNRRNSPIGKDVPEKLELTRKEIEQLKALGYIK